MNRFRFVFRSLSYFWRIHLAIGLGVITAVAVLAGALIVGDSVRYSLRSLMLDRLGRIHTLLWSEHYFSSQLARHMESDPSFREHFADAVPLVLFRNATVEVVGGDAVRRVRGVLLLGVEADFWQLGDPPQPPASQPGRRQIVVNGPLADQLQLKPDERLIVRMPQTTAVAGDSVMADKDNRSRSLTDLEVVDILAPRGLGRFSLSPTQHDLPLAAMDLSTIQQALGRQDQVNAIAIARPPGAPRVLDDLPAPPVRTLHPQVSDLGLQLDVIQRTYQRPADPSPHIAYRYLHLSTERMVFPLDAERVLAGFLEQVEAEPVVTYLANSIERLDERGEVLAEVPYSTVSAVVSDRPLSPLRNQQGEPLGPLAAGQIALNSWTAEQLQAQPGDRIRLRYFAPETTHGEAVEQAADFTLAHIVPLVEPHAPYRGNQPARYEQPPAWGNDPDLTPTVEGVTDQESIDDWDPPFPYDQRRIRPEDEDYWDNHRATPKAFVAFDEGRKLWGSRFGAVTSYRIPLTETQTEQMIEQGLVRAVHGNEAVLGFAWLQLLRDGLEASAGTTPFEGLFLGFSFFIIISAVMLIALLFRLGIEQRSSEAGVLLAVGLSGRQLGVLFLLQGLAIALLASLLGLLVAIAYGQLMVLGLRTIWIEAIVTPFIRLRVEPVTCLLGAGLGALVSLLAIGWTCRRLAQRQVRDLVGGSRGEQTWGLRRRPWRYPLAGLLVFAALGIGFSAVRLSGELQALAFLGGGFCVLVAALLAFGEWLYRSGRGGVRLRSMALGSLARRNLIRHAGRSQLTVGLLAAACFLIVAISAFRLPPTDKGTGGFELMAESDRAIFVNLDDPQGRAELLGGAASALEGSRIFSMRLVDGDDASCRNLYQVSRPKLVGVSPALQSYFDDPQRSGFAWAAAAGQADNPWQLLSQELHSDEANGQIIPVILDRNTALYSFHLQGRVGEEFEFDYGEQRRLRFRTVGLLANSTLQGALLISEQQLVRHFPEVAGYRFFLLDVPPDREEAVTAALERGLRDEGLYVQDSRVVLQQLLAVQNTYLSTFQALGGLGLLLGTAGLAAVQFRSVLERRGELALMMSFGFARSRLAQLVMLEHVTLLTCGLAMGVFAALVVVLPHWMAGGAAAPWLSLSAMLAAIFIVGLASGWWAVRQSLATPLLEALRGE
jgi:putative ABC transport system permease protein